MIETRAKGADIANPLKYKLDLQLFSDEGESAEPDSSSFDSMSETVEEPSQAQESELVHNEDTPAIAEQESDKTVQDDKTNAAFAEMRRKMEAMEKREAFGRKYGQYGVFDESDISKKYGDRGIHTVQQLDQAIENQRRENERQEWIDSGYDPDEIERLVDSKLNNHPSVVAARETEFNNTLMQNYNELTSEYSDLVKSPEDISPDVWAKWNQGRSGLSLTDAYTLVNRKEIAAKQQAAIKQAALNNMSSKNHLRPNGADGSSAADMTQIPSDVLSTYKKLVPGKTDQFYIDHYKRSIKGG